MPLARKTPRSGPPRIGPSGGVPEPPRFVFLPGLLETPEMWSQVTAGLTLPPVHVDLPGHRPGDSAGAVRADLASGAWLDRTAARIRRRTRGRPAVFVGHSTGAMLCIRLARHYPELVHSLVLVNALTCGHRDRTHDRLGALIGHALIGPAAFRALWHLWLSTPFTFRRGFTTSAAMPARLPEARAMRAKLLACDPAAVRACALWVLQTSVAGDLAHVRVPLLALIGRADPVVPPAHQLRLVQRAPNAQAQLLEGGHLLYAEKPAHLRWVLRNWPVLAARRGRAPHGRAPTPGTGRNAGAVVPPPNGAPAPRLTS